MRMQPSSLPTPGCYSLQQRRSTSCCSLWSGEWFENMQSQDLARKCLVPYRRETFTDKKVILDFDGNFSLMDAAALSNNAAGKSLSQIRHDIDSLNETYDSIGNAFWNDTNGYASP
jgi:lipopolysaccharide export system permease protein